MNFVDSIKLNILGLANFRGRETRAQFWPFAIPVIAIAVVAIQLAMWREFTATMESMRRFAAENPSLATEESGPGGYSIHIHGFHPELMPNIDKLLLVLGVIAVVLVLILAAAATRRLHDVGKTGAWGLWPPLLLVTGSILLRQAFSLSDFSVTIVLAAFVNNALYLAFLLYLVILLARPSAGGANRYGPAVTAPNVPLNG